MKIKLLLPVFILLSFSYGATANFILNTGGLLDERAAQKINTIGTEVNTKLGVHIYLDVKGDNGINPDLPLKERIAIMKTKEEQLILQVQNDMNQSKSFAILTLALDQKYANILMSDDLKSILDRDSILDGYVIPLVAAQDKNTLNSKVSAATLNGYAQIADSLAKNKNITLQSSIGSEGKIASTIWKVFMYTIVLIGIILYFVIILREKKIKKAYNEKLKKEANGEKDE
ncbi:MAG: hypothetical protein PHF17_10900 [Arcobacteraceae bacterium]|nr:hypothetical protein [Arcobacteraceae bacterium]